MRQDTEAETARYLRARARFGPLEIAFWLVAFSTIWLLPTRHLILTETVIWGLFALSLNLILGYAGIISLGHAAFFGVGAYAAGLLAKHEIINEPSFALLASALAAAALGFATSFLVLRGSDLTRLMVTLGVSLVCLELANRYGEVTGGADGLQGVTIAPVFGLYRFDMFGHTAYVYCLVVLFILFMLARRIVNSPFGLSLKAIKGNPLRSAAVGIAVNWRLVAVYTLSAGYAGVAGGLLAQTQAFASLSMLSLERSADALLILIIGGTGYLYGGILGALIYRLLQDYLSDLTARYWQFWIGLLLVMMVLFGRVYGAIIAASIFVIPRWLSLSFTTTIIFTVGVTLTLGFFSKHILKWITALEQWVLHQVRKMWARPEIAGVVKWIRSIGRWPSDPDAAQDHLPRKR
jgi:branched-chain amino acid transport system permease protein